jgi:hypothetical protein
LAPGFRSNWQVYAAAAGAAVAMATNAQAGVVYGTVGKTVTISGASSRKQGTFQLPIHGGMGHVTENIALGHSASTGYAKITGAIQFATVNGKNGSGARSAKDFAQSALVGPLIPVTGGGATFLAKHFSNGTVVGQFQGVRTGFLGFNTVFGDYGWLRIKVSDTGSPGFANSINVIDYAYDTTGASIPAGLGSPTPEPGTTALSLLALGAAGILAYRRRLKEVTE